MTAQSQTKSPDRTAGKVRGFGLDTVAGCPPFNSAQLSSPFVFAPYDSYPEHEREARTKGIPSLGSGRVFPIAEETILCDPIPIPKHWFQIVGIDFGWEHPFAATAAVPRANTVRKGAGAPVLNSCGGFRGPRSAPTTTSPSQTRIGLPPTSVLVPPLATFFMLRTGCMPPTFATQSRPQRTWLRASGLVRFVPRADVRIPGGSMTESRASNPSPGVSLIDPLRLMGPRERRWLLV